MDGDKPSNRVREVSAPVREDEQKVRAHLTALRQSDPSNQQLKLEARVFAKVLSWCPRGWSQGDQQVLKTDP